MMIRQPLPASHIELTRRTWNWIRQGLLRCQANPDDCQTCLRWCQRFPDATRMWQEILQGQQAAMVDIALKTKDYFDLPAEARAWWEKILQNHPFAAIFAREHYAELIRRRKEQHKSDGDHLQGGLHL